MDELTIQVNDLKNRLYIALGLENPTAEVYAKQSDINKILSGEVTVLANNIVSTAVTLSPTALFTTSMVNLVTSKGRGSKLNWTIAEGNTAGMPSAGAWSGTVQGYDASYILVNAHRATGTLAEMSQEFYRNKSYYDGWGTWKSRSTVVPTVSNEASTLNGFTHEYYATNEALANLQAQVVTLNSQLDTLQAL